MATNTEKQREVITRSAKGWLCVHAVFSVFGLSVVPGFGEFLLAAVVFGAIVVAVLKRPSSRKALTICVMFSLACGFAARKISYEDAGLTSGLFLLTLLIAAVSVLLAYYVMDEEKQREAESG
ncbi:hypothetical protein LVB87_00745 [Lysobacter sp. KIS68-7]|uniref:hypothetical protein n=1 Tax=Lysobacter sp. KIS68-7 TaxID=2904252 RepID=UPI001E4FF78C|nr:hypothetical protein [Lysobacter sp. KIS68-7]UHQ19731.1 hypothetical protein LVB87_00745 [Lysobacter sp. KIS68-7]